MHVQNAVSDLQWLEHLAIFHSKQTQGKKQIYCILAVYGGLGRLATRFLFVHNNLMGTRLLVWSHVPHTNMISLKYAKIKTR